MTEGKKDLWNVTDNNLECYGSKKVKNGKKFSEY